MARFPNHSLLFCFTSQDVDIYISALYLDCDVFMLPLTSPHGILSGGWVIYRENNVTRWLHTTCLFCPIDEKLLTSNLQIKKDLPALEGHPSTGLNVSLPASEKNMDIFNKLPRLCM